MNSTPALAVKPPVQLTVDDFQGFDMTYTQLVSTCKTCLNKVYAETTGEEAKQALVAKLNQIIADRT